MCLLALNFFVHPLEFCINAIIQHVVFCIWLLINWHNIFKSHPGCSMSQSFIRCTERRRFLYPSFTNGHVNCFHLVAPVNGAARSVCVEFLIEHLLPIVRSICLRMESLGLTGTACVTCGGTARSSYRGGIARHSYQPRLRAPTTLWDTAGGTRG